MNPFIADPMRRDLFNSKGGCEHAVVGTLEGHTCDACVCMNVLFGMYADIKKGDLFLRCATNTVEESLGLDGHWDPPIEGHHYKIRLPDWKQKPKHTHKFVCECGEENYEIRF